MRLAENVEGVEFIRCMHMVALKGQCYNQADFHMDDIVTGSSYFCWEHIGEHLHYCNQEYDDHKSHKMKKVKVEYV